MATTTVCHERWNCIIWRERKYACILTKWSAPSGCDFKYMKACICVKKLNKHWEILYSGYFPVTLLHFIISPFWNSWAILENCLSVLTGQPSSILFPLLPNWPRLVLEAPCPTVFKVQSHAELSTLSAVTPLMQTDMSHAKDWLAPNIM